MIVTVADIMKLDLLKTSPVKAGFNGLGKQVTAITIIEAPDIAEWIYGGEILLTTLYSATQAKLPLKEYFEQLAQRGVSAIMVKTGRAIDQLPPELISVGNRYNIPIIELQLEVRYIDIINSGTRLLLDSSEQKLSYYMDIQRELTKLMISGTSVEEIIEYLEQKVHAKLSVLDEHHIELFQNTTTYTEKTASPAMMTVPISCFGKTQGYLQATSESLLSEEQCVILNNAADIIAMEFMKRHYIAEIEQKYANDFIDELLSGNVDLAHISEKLKLYGLRIDDNFVVAILQPAHGQAQPKAAMEQISKIFTNNPSWLCRVRSDSLTLLWHGSVEEKPTATTWAIDQLEPYRSQLYCGISNANTGISNIGKLQKEALDALNYAKLFETSIVDSNDLGVLKLFSRFSSREELWEMIPNCIKQLIEHDKANNTAYLHTLDVIIHSNYNLSLSAKKLYLHYKTILHRSQRISELGNISFESSHDRLQLEIGLKLYSLLNSN